MDRDDTLAHAMMVLEALREATEVECGGHEAAVAFSGGIDSSIVACLLGGRVSPTLYTVGVEGCYDLSIGEETADFLGLRWKSIVVDEESITRAILDICNIIPTRNPVTISFEIPLYFVASSVPEEDIYSGQGADELFAGYARYNTMEMGELERSLSHDLAQLMERGLDYERRIASSHNKRLHYIYLHRKVVDVVRSIPVWEEFRGEERKAVLRDVARLLYLGEIADRRKKAAQYGSGIMNTLRKAAKYQGMSVRAYIRVLTQKGEIP